MSLTTDNSINTISPKTKEFNRVFDSIENEIPFDPEWKNGTGYLDGATHIELKPGEQAKSTDDHGRRIIMTGTRYGTVVLFKRYTNEDSNIYVSNWPRKFPNFLKEIFIRESSHQYEDIMMVLGAPEYSDLNVGQRIERISNQMKAESLVGQKVMVEFGNKFDTSGYLIESARVLSFQYRFSNVFLVATPSKIGIATEKTDEEGNTYFVCTDSRELDLNAPVETQKDPFRPMELVSAYRSLGFNLSKSSVNR